ncbi:PqiC family protein [Roseateles toxinivorans]|nr:PqiC family protein [Roseateles toxinivorans]
MPTRLLSVALLLLVNACSSSPPVQLYQLRADPPGPALQITAGAGERWALGAVQLPEYLDRDALLRPSGQAGLTALTGHRWAEPLRDAVPRLLQQDLARLRGADQVWRAPVPPGVVVGRQLRVEIQQLEARADGLGVVLAARWMLIDPSGKSPAQVFDGRIEVPSAEATPDALVSAHRAALWQLAQDIQRRAD